MQPDESPKPKSPPYHGVVFRKAKSTVRRRFANIDDPAVARAYDQAQEERAECLGWGSPDPVYSNVPSFYIATIFLRGKSRYLGCARKADEAARLYDAALFHLWGFVQRKRKASLFNFYKPGDASPEFSPRLREIRHKIRCEWFEKLLKDRDGVKLETQLHIDNFDFNFLNEQN